MKGLNPKLDIEFFKYDFKSRTRNSVFGTLWVLAFPITVFAAHLYFATNLYENSLTDQDITCLLLGSMSWYYMSQSLVMNVNAFVYRSDLIKTTNINKDIFSRITIYSNLLVSSMAFFLTSAIMTMFGMNVWGNINFPMLVFAQVNLILFTYAASIIISHLNVFYRDIVHIVNFLMQVIFFTTPIVFKVEKDNVVVNFIQSINPFYYLFESLRLTGGIVGKWSMPYILTMSSIFVVAALLCAYVIRKFLTRRIYFYV